MRGCLERLKGDRNPPSNYEESHEIQPPDQVHLQDYNVTWEVIITFRSSNLSPLWEQIVQLIIVIISEQAFGMTDQSIGIMEGAFFVPATELLAWINSMLELDVEMVEQLGTGAVYCQIFDMMYPGKINMSRVNWRARNEWEFIQNLKILQASFEKCLIKKHIQIQRLAKSKYQDNLEFIQWFKRFFELNGGCKVSNYDPRARRNGQADFSFVGFRGNPRKRQMQEQMRRKGRSKSPILLDQSDAPHRDRSKRRNYSLNHRYKKYEPKEQGKYYLSKLQQIKKILNHNPDDSKQKQIQKIKTLMKDIDEIEQEVNIEDSSNGQSQPKKLKTFK